MHAARHLNHLLRGRRFRQLFAVRVAVMLPLYLAGEVAWLGVAKVALGWPAYLLAIVVMGMLLATGRTAQTADGDDDVTERMEAVHEAREPHEDGNPS